jgi:hypothetical protein
MPRAPRPGPTTARKLLYTLIVTLVVVGGAELVLQLTWTEPVAEGQLDPDPLQRWTLPRSSSIVLAGVEVATNSLRYRGDELATERPPCAWRIYAAGDSSVFGHGVPQGGSYIELLERLATPPDGIEIEAINGGVPGYSTYQSMSRLEETGWSLSPDLLVIGNLWSDSSRAEVADRILLGEQELAQQRAGIGALLGRSALFRLGQGLLVERERVYAMGTPTGPVVRVEPEEYHDNLIAMVRGVRRRGGEALLLLLPHPTDQKDLNDPWERETLAHGGPETGHAHREVMRAVARDEGAILLDTSREVATVAAPLFLDEVHPNVAGHQLIAEALAGTLAAHPELFDAAEARCVEATPR